MSKFNFKNFIRFCGVIILSFYAQNALSNKHHIQNMKNMNLDYLYSNKIYLDKEENFFESSGNVKLLANDFMIKSDNFLVDIDNKHLYLYGNVSGYFQPQKIKFYTTKIDYNLPLKTGSFNNLGLFIPPSIKATAESGNSTEKYVFSFKNILCTSCRVKPNENPIWQIRAEDLKLDFNSNSVKLKKAHFEFFGKKILPIPFFNFPMPNSPSKSGILTPALKYSRVELPFFLSLRPNTDLTFTPSFNNKIFVGNLEFRHLNKNGKVNFNFNAATKSKKQNRLIYGGYFYEFAADFKDDKWFYGVKTTSVANNSYLKNHFTDNRIFLKSNIYLSKFLENSYFIAEQAYFDDLRLTSEENKRIGIFPQIKYRKYIELNDNIDLTINDNFLNYLIANNGSSYRNNLTLNLSKYYYGNRSEIFKLSLYNRLDLYYNINKENNFLVDNENKKTQLLSRNIPEIHASFRKAFITTLLNKYQFIIEPRIQAIIGAKAPANYLKYAYIDSPNKEINEFNIFSNNRYSGLDFHEYGQRLNYGINGIFVGEKFKVNGFIGQIFQTQSMISNSKSDYLGMLNICYDDIFEVYYRFQRRSKNFHPHREELGIWYNDDKLKIKSNFIALRDLDEYNNFYRIYDESLNRNHITQNKSQIEFKINDKWSVFGSVRLGFGKNLKTKLLDNNFGFIYYYDCIKLMAKYSQDYSFDIDRNVRKKKSFSVFIGLKEINM